MYADDTCILVPSPAGIQKLLDMCSVYALHYNYVLFNEAKTKCMCFKPKGYNLCIPTVKLNNTPLIFTDTCNYLGIMLHYDLQDDDDLLRHVKFIYAKGNILVSRFIFCSDDVKLKLFRSYLCSLYGGQLWYNYNVSSFKKVVVAYNNVFRKFFGIQRGVSMSQIYMLCGVNSIGAIHRKNVYNFSERIVISDNSIVQHLRHSCYNTYVSSVAAKNIANTLYMNVNT